MKRKEKSEKAKNKNENRSFRKQECLFILVFFLLSVVCIVFGILCFSKMRYAFIQKYQTACSIVYSIIICSLCALSVWGALTEKETLTKTLFSGYILLTFCLILIYILQRTGFFAVVSDPESLQTYLENAGAWMPVVYMILQFLQVVVLPIPSVVSTVVGVALFGALRATVYSLIGIVIGSLLAFFIGRKIGYKAVAWMVGEDSLRKWQKKLKGKDNLILTIMFILPLFPDDVLCFLAGLSSMSTRYFVIMILIARVLGVAGTCFSVDFIPFNTWWGILIWGLFFAAIVTVFILIYKYMDKIQNFLAKRFQCFRKKKK
ncbi:MAG: TVP38/TMEM64 family protein [Clostridia bacterium]|nr:TVP38/TMEM64 family protein [Clostridia bacterium]